MQLRNTSIILVIFGTTVAISLFWNWPFKVSEIGGGPSVLIYLVLLLIVGIPVVLVELALGSWSKSVFPTSLKMINSKLEFFGWFALINTFWLLTGLCAILSWTFSLACYTLGRFYPLSNWIFPMTGAFDFSNYFFNHSSPLLPLIGLSIIWGTIFLISIFDRWGSIIKKTAIKIVFPTLAIIMVITLILTASLAGGVNPGLNFYLGFDPQVFLSGSSWRTLTTLLFFNLGAGLGILSFYTSKNSEGENKLTSLTIIATLLGAGLIFLGGMIFFTMSGTSGLTILFGSINFFPMGILGFPAAPFIGWSAGFAIIERGMGFLVGKSLALLFYTLTFIAGILGLTFLIEPIKETLRTKFNLNSRKLLAILVGAGFLASIPFTLTSKSPWGYYLTSLSNWWVEGFGLALIVLVELITVGWIWGAEKVVGYINNNSHIRIPRWFKWIIKFVAPATVIITLVIGVYDTLKGYVSNSWGILSPLTAFQQTLAPWYTNPNFVFPILALLWLTSNTIIAIILTRRKPKEEKVEKKKKKGSE
jgi:NSS family neurotransmitter:Na+ symporter